jgi:nucleotide-binding universal stress UspA family protein
VVPGIPGEVLVDFAREKGTDLVIVGVRRRGVLKKSFIGSTTEAVLRNAPCAVLTVPHATKVEPSTT